MNKIVVVTGSSSGIGRALCGLLRSRGDTVIGLCRRPGENDLACDVTDETQVAAAFAAIGARYGKIDLLVNNAGLGISGATELLDPQKARYVFEVDYFGLYACCRHALQWMGRGGRIVNISSACALFALPYRTIYCAAKAAVNMLGLGLNMELKRAGIRVVTVCPGDVKTEFTENRIKQVTVSERYGQASERSAAHIDSRQDKRMNVDKVARKILRVCDKGKKPMVIIGAKYKALYIAQKLLPQRWILAATNKLFNKA